MSNVGVGTSAVPFFIKTLVHVPNLKLGNDVVLKFASQKYHSILVQVVEAINTNKNG